MTAKDIQCEGRLQDEPAVISFWLPAGRLTTLPDTSVALSKLYLHVQPLCASHFMESYDLPVTLVANQSAYSLALPNADFTLNCSGQEASWQLDLRAITESRYAMVNGTQPEVLTLPAGEAESQSRI